MKAKIQLIGHLGQDPSLTQLKDGSDFCFLRICVNSTEKKEGVTTKRADWFDCEATGSKALAYAKYLRKGRKVFLEGWLILRVMKNDKFTNAEGKPATVYYPRVIVRDIEFLDSRSEGESSGQ